jgi:hypothetical protein
MVPSMVNEIYIIRFAVCAKYATDDDMNTAFHIIREHADRVLVEYTVRCHGRASSSSDSLDLIAKANPLECDPIVEVHATVDTTTESPICQPRRARVSSGSYVHVFSIVDGLVQGNDNNNDYVSSCDI